LGGTQFSRLIDLAWNKVNWFYIKFLEQLAGCPCFAVFLYPILHEALMIKNEFRQLKQTIKGTLTFT
jgi:hypothetical protein